MKCGFLLRSFWKHLNRNLRLPVVLKSFHFVKAIVEFQPRAGGIDDQPRAWFRDVGNGRDVSCHVQEIGEQAQELVSFSLPMAGLEWRQTEFLCDVVSE